MSPQERRVLDLLRTTRRPSFFTVDGDDGSSALEFRENATDLWFAIIELGQSAPSSDAAPLARVNLDARDIHCLTQGGEIHRGATVGTTPEGLVALQAAEKRERRFYTIAQPLGVFVAGGTSDLSGSIWIGLTPAPKPPKVGDRWGDLTTEQRASLKPGTAMYRMCSGKQAIAVLGTIWRVICDGVTREVPAEDLADDNAILSLPESK
jgi:hypothetical protein